MPWRRGREPHAAGRWSSSSPAAATKQPRRPPRSFIHRTRSQRARADPQAGGRSAAGRDAFLDPATGVRAFRRRSDVLSSETDDGAMVWTTLASRALKRWRRTASHRPRARASGWVQGRRARGRSGSATRLDAAIFRIHLATTRACARVGTLDPTGARASARGNRSASQHGRASSPGPNGGGGRASWRRSDRGASRTPGGRHRRSIVREHRDRRGSVAEPGAARARRGRVLRAGRPPRAAPARAGTISATNEWHGHVRTVEASSGHERGFRSIRRLDRDHCRLTQYLTGSARCHIFMTLRRADDALRR